MKPPNCVLLVILFFTVQLAFAQPPTLDWVNQYDGPAAAMDLCQQVATGPDGSVYLAGSSTGIGTGLDYTIVKYDAAGNHLWTARFDRAGFNDRLTGIAVDPVGNVYATGSGQTTAAFSTTDYTTIKFDKDGQLLWSSFYNGPANAVDFPQGGVHIGPQGNIYVTGNSTGLMPGRDMATVSYAPDGTQRWVAIHDGPAHTFGDAGLDIAFDNAGSLYVAGTSDELTNNDYVTIKYNAANGAEIWKTLHNGIGTLTNQKNQEDRAFAIAYDATNDAVYVTGQSPQFDAGLSTTGMDIVTIKYNATTGAELWKNRYDGPQASGDLGRGIALDASGSPVIVGLVNHFTTPPRPPVDVVVIKYNPANGNRVWTSFYDGPANNEENLFMRNPIATDQNNNTYVSSVSTGVGTGFDLATIKFDPSGNMLWDVRHDGPANANESAASLFLDMPNLFMAGTSQAPGPNDDFVVLKYSIGPVVPPWQLWSSVSGNQVQCLADITDPSGINASSISLQITRPDGSNFRTFNNTTTPPVVQTAITNGYNASLLFNPGVKGVWIYTWSATNGDGKSLAKAATFYYGGPKKVINLIDEGGHTFKSGKTLEDMLNITDVSGSGTLQLKNIDFSANKKLKLKNFILDGQIVIQSVTLNREIAFTGGTVVQPGGLVNLTGAVVNAIISFDDTTVGGTVFFNGASVAGPVVFENGAMVTPSGYKEFSGQTTGFTCDGCTIN